MVLDSSHWKIVLGVSEEFQMAEDHQHIKIVDSSVCDNAYTILISGNMWHDTNKVTIHLNGMAPIKKINCIA